MGGNGVYTQSQPYMSTQHCLWGKIDSLTIIDHTCVMAAILTERGLGVGGAYL